MKFIDLRSDTVTMPTQEMLDSIPQAELGDDVNREDPTVNKLERLAAERFGKEAALLLPSGTQSNLVALIVSCSPGDEMILEEESHIYYYEVGGFSAVRGISPRLIKGERGIFTPEQVEEAYRGRNLHFPDPTLLEIENTHNRAGGTVWKVEEVAAVSKVAHELGMNVHIDGARIFNATKALGVSVKDYAKHVESISFCLSKGLSAPVGSLLVADDEFIEEARKARKMLGGGMRQAGIIAAPGLIALNKMVDRLGEDHDNAQKLARGLSAMEGLNIDMEAVQTNIVVVDISPLGISADEFKSRTKEVGVLVSKFGKNLVRFVTHRGISEEDIDITLSRMESIRF